MEKFQLFNVGIYSLNILSMMLGFVCGAYVFRRHALLITAIYFGGLAFYYYIKSST